MPESDSAEKLRERKVSLQRQVVAAYEREYRDLVESWKSVETKAQGTVAMAGIFLAAVFAFARGVSANEPGWQRWILTTAILTLLASVLFALLSLWGRKVASPPPPVEIEQDVCLMMPVSDPVAFAEYERRLGADEARQWRGCTDALRNAYEIKTGWLLRAQGAILVAAVLVSLLTIAALFDGNPRVAVPWEE
ncbi:MAG TPA: hypothetical protein VFQ45_09895 [Longimicrobium sp.]|nr:hypothetical protein [Longimicrobium sp.]